MARKVTEVNFISDKMYDRVHDKDAFMSTVYRYKAGTKEWKNYIKEHYVPGWKDIMASEIKEVIDSFKNTDILVDFYSPSYDVFYNKSKGTYEITTTKGSFVSKDYDEVVDWYYDLVTDNGKYLLTI